MAFKTLAYKKLPESVLAFYSDWKRGRWAYTAALAWVCTPAIGGLVFAVFRPPGLTAALVCGLVFLFALLFLRLFHPVWKVDFPSLMRYLNREVRPLEDSALLLLKEESALSKFEKRQALRIADRLPAYGSLPLARQRKKRTISAFCLGFLLWAWCLFLPELSSVFSRPSIPDSQGIAPAGGEMKKDSMASASVRLWVVPPAYTRLPSFESELKDLEVPVGSRVSWILQLDARSSPPVLIWNAEDSLRLTKQAENPPWVHWHGSRAIEHTGFYKFENPELPQEYFSIRSLPDALPQITLLLPNENSQFIDLGMPQQLTFRAIMQDDFGLSSAVLKATLTRGKGEGVQFEEVELPLRELIPGTKNQQFARTILLKDWAMNPGDAAYWHLEALDNAGQLGRSAVFAVSLADTTELMQMSSMHSSTDLMPAYFRSQRQIILDAEQLLKEKSTLEEKTFATRSNELGVDQKLLRLRYGQFLGEEFEEEIGPGGHEHEEEGPVTVESLMEAYTHHHDDAEDATFFTPAQKQQLKAILNEMWSAELNLRLQDPQAALPAAYRALRLLKDLQQQDRVYAAKTSSKLPQPDEKKRLQGDLEGIQTNQRVQQAVQQRSEEEVLRAFHARLSLVKQGVPLSARDEELRQSAEKRVIEAAKVAPEDYLPLLSKIQKLNQPLSPSEINALQRDLLKLISSSPKAPQAAIGGKKETLFEAYIQKLKPVNKSWR